MKFYALATIFALAATLGQPLSAQQLTTPALPGEVAPAPSTTEGTLALTLPEAYELALSRNLDLQVGRYDVAKADASIAGATGTFDPQLSLGVSGDWSKAPAATQLAGADVNVGRDAKFDLGLATVLPTGTNLSVDSSTTRSETNSTFFFLNPRWNTDLTVSLRQPLLQGFGTLVNRSAIVVARNSRDQTAASFAIKVISTLQTVENAYWDLVATRKAVEVRQQSLELAQRLLRETQERVKVGTAAPIDTVQSEATVAARRQELITAGNAAANAEDALKAVLGFDQPDEWDVHIKTAEELTSKRIHPKLADSIDLALKRRPEVHSLLLSIELAALNTRVARNTVLPRLDLQANYGWGGLGGNFKVVDSETGQVISTQPGGLDDALRQLRKQDFPHWSLGITFGIPLGNNDAKARLAQRRYELDQAKVQLNALKQQITRDVRIAVRALEDGAANIDAAEAAQAAAQRNLEAEQTKYNNGLSTNYQVLQIQDDLAGAKLTALQAEVAYRRALVGYRYATGMLLDDEHVAIVDPGQPEIPHDYWKNVRWLQFVDFRGDKTASKPVQEPSPETVTQKNEEDPS